MTEIMEASKFQFYLEKIYTKLQFKSAQDSKKFLTTSMETAELRPHGDDECNCDVLHLTSFRLKTVVEKKTLNFFEIILYISLDQNTGSEVGCRVFWSGGSYTPYILLRDTHQTYTGWKYLTKIQLDFKAEEDNLVIYFHYYKNETPTPSLSTNLACLLIDETYSDVTISSHDGATIKAHRGILAKRCEVFRAALEHNETTDQITSHFHEKTLRQIMTYIYTDEAPKIGDFTSDLFMAADYYQLSALKDFCQSAFHLQLKVENAIATLELAERHSLTDLMTFTLKFMKKNFGLIIDTEDWKNVKSLSLVKMICEFIAPKSLSKASQSK